jgi:hypothetical protein
MMLSPLPGSITEHFDFIENLARGLPGPTGNTMLLLWLGVPDPATRIVIPEASRRRMNCTVYFDVGDASDDFISHDNPDGNTPVYKVDFEDFRDAVRKEIRARLRGLADAAEDSNRRSTQA